MKTILITIYDGDTEKLFLRSGVLRFLKESEVRIVLLIRSKERVDYYRNNFSDTNIIVECLTPALTSAERFWYHISWNTLPTYSAYIKRYDLYLKHKNSIRYAVERFFGLLGCLRLWRHLLRKIYYWIPDDYSKDLFKKYKPDLLFSPNMFSAEDCRLLKQAKKLGVQTVTTAKSWDVLTTRGFTRVIADRLLVFNEINKREAVAIGDYRPEHVKIIGFPQFDVYTKKDIYMSRDEFFKKIGADPGKKLILFAVPGDFKNPYTHEIVLMLDKAIEEKKIRYPVQILARFHPKYPATSERLTNLRHFILDRPGTYFAKDLERSIDAPASATFQWTYTDKDIIHLANSLHHSDVTINSESTITLDAAAHDKPIILIGFDGNQKLDYWRSIIRNYDREHFKDVFASGGVYLAHTMEDLIDSINTYLDNPKMDAEKRLILRDNLLYKSDGQSARRTADAILEML